MVIGVEIKIKKTFNWGNNGVFSGYVSSVGSDVPIEIKCEDNFYFTKTSSV